MAVQSKDNLTQQRVAVELNALRSRVAHLERREAELESALQPVPPSEQLIELEHLYETAPVGLCLLNTELRYVRVNRLLAEFNGSSVEEHLGRTIFEIMPDLAQKAEQIIRQVIATGVPALECEVRGATTADLDYQQSWSVNYYPVKSSDGSVREVSIVVHEITGQKIAEEAARRAQDELEGLIAERTTELEAANSCLVAEAKERDRAEQQARKHLAELAHLNRLGTMGEMVSGLAHELNQPLTAIANFADVCEQALTAESPPEKEYLTGLISKIADQAYRSGEIIRRLRGLVRKSETRRTSIDPNQLVREVVDLLGLDARLKEVRLQLELQEDVRPVVVDRIQLQQVALNLIRNAVEAVVGQEEARSTVHIRTSTPRTGQSEIVVEDAGIGIGEEDPERLFDAFYTTKNDGMGMGLAISRSIVEIHCGKLSAEKNPVHGMTFRIQLPAEE